MLPMNKIFALGFFDDVHLGHQALLKICCDLAAQMGAQPCAITFQQHPQSLFTQEPPKLINTAADRQRLLHRFGIGPVFSYPVTKAVMSMPWEAFLDELVSYDAVGFVCGNDFRFGNCGEGDARKIEDYCRRKNLAVQVVGDQILQGIRISSTHIRNLLESGRMEEAVRFLGHPHVLTGEVVAGRQIGRTLGIPTANLKLPEDVVHLRHGVYACKATVNDHTYLAVTNVGNRPTVGGHVVTVEPWLLDFKGNLYGRELMLEFYQFLRPEKKFDSLEALKEAIRENERQTRWLFTEHKGGKP
jgi:riboflavin kinase/FMN adenylyltransferase